MRNIIKFLTNPLLIAVIGLLAITVIIWFGGPMLGFNDSRPLESETSRLITILIVTLLWGLNNFRVQNAQKKKDATMLGEIAQAKAPSTNNPRETEENKQIQLHFNNALDILKTSKKHQTGNRVPIHELPWYIIIGPPGSGKTTALLNSGLRFPLAERMGQQPLKGVGGTRNCDWWFSDDAILIDTAGRYTTQDSDQSADSGGWQGFLNLLKKHRPRQPINGAIVTISLVELISQSAAERQQHAHLIKHRLQELYDNLAIEFPVYVMLTKTDLIAGFNEYFDNLSRGEREQILGVTFPINESFNSTFDIQTFKEEMDALMRRLNSRLQWRLQEERDVSRRALILNLPTELSSLKDMLANFLESVFKPNAFDKAINIRGIYFTSGTQEGTPIDRVMGAMAANFGLNRQTIPTYSGQGKSFFLTQLFRQQIFPEAVIAGTNRLHEQKQTWMRRSAYLISLLATVGFAGLWTSQYTSINQEMEQLTTQISIYQDVANELPANINKPEVLLASLEELRKASTVVSIDNRSLFSQAGLSQMRSLGPATDEAYKRTLLHKFYPSLIAILEQSLTEETIALESLFINLKTYLIMADKKRFDQEAISEWFSTHWALAFAGNMAKQNSLNTHLASLFELDVDLITGDSEIIADAQRKLQNIALSQRIYANLKQMGRKSLPAFFITNVINSEEQQIFVNKNNENEALHGIPGLYTKEGYEAFFREESISQAEASTEDDWVFGKTSDEKKSSINPEKIHQEIEQLYMKDFIRHWENLLNDIKLTNIDTLEQGVEVIESIAGANPALNRILAMIDNNTDLRSKANLLQQVGEDKLKKLGKAGKKAAKTVNSDIPLTPVGVALRKHFSNIIELSTETDGKPAGIQQHLLALIKLQTYLNEIITATEPKEAALQSAILRMNSNGKDVIGKLRRDARRMPPALGSWINTLTADSWKIILSDSRQYLNTRWKNQVIRRFEQSIKNRYPIYKSSTQQTSVEDFSDFFAPEGQYLSFLKNNIFAFFNTRNKTWKTKYLEGQGISVSQATLKQLQRGKNLSDAFFPNNADILNVRFQLTPVKLDAKAKRISIKFDNEEITYRHEPPRASSLSWPFSENPESSIVSVYFHTNTDKIGVRKKGSWAFFQLLDDASIKKTNLADKYNVSLSIKGYTAIYSLKANSVVNPFDLTELHAFRLPTKI